MCPIFGRFSRPARILDNGSWLPVFFAAVICYTFSCIEGDASIEFCFGKGGFFMRSVKTIQAAKTSYIIMSALFCVLGFVLIAFPGISVSFVGIAAGIMLIAFGVVKLVGYFSKDLYRLAFQFDLAFGALLVVLGIVILTNPESALSFLCMMLGIVIMADGFFKLQSSLDARRFGLRSWWAMLGLGVCAGLMGAALLVWPDKSAQVMMILLGVGLLVEGILNLCMGLFAIKIIKRQQPEIAQTVEYWIDKDE